MSDNLIEWLRTYWSDNYNGPPMASDELGRKAANALEAMQKEIIELQARIDGYHLVEGRMTKRIAELEDALKWIDFNTIDVGARRVCKEALKDE